MTSYRPASGMQPCKECPFRRKAMPGWLGAATPESFIVEISMERPLPCHPTINYTDDDWLEKWREQSVGNICAGSLIMSANMNKVPRDRSFPRLPQDKAAVFATHQEFCAHHNNAQVRSWEMDTRRGISERVAGKPKRK